MKKVSCHKGLLKGLKRGIDNPNHDSFDLTGVIILVVMIGIFFLLLTIFGG